MSNEIIADIHPSVEIISEISTANIDVAIQTIEIIGDIQPTIEIVADLGVSGLLIEAEISEAGYTPVKGIDYFTPEEVQQITNQIASDINPIQYITQATLPTIGTSNVLYIDKTINKSWYWDADNICYITASGGDYHDIKIINGGVANG